LTLLSSTDQHEIILLDLMLEGFSIFALADKVEDMEGFNLVTVLQNILISFFTLALL